MFLEADSSLAGPSMAGSRRAGQAARFSGDVNDSRLNEFDGIYRRSSVS